MNYKIAISADGNIATLEDALQNTSINNDGTLYYGARYNVTTQKISLDAGFISCKIVGKIAFYTEDDECLQVLSENGEDFVSVPRGTSYFRCSTNTYGGLQVVPNVVPYRVVNPIYGDNVALEYNKESGQQFFRKKITGEFTFCRSDFDFLMSKDFDFVYDVEMLKSDADNAPFERYAQGKFVRTDCKINETEKTLKTSFSERDEYTEVLAGLDNEYDLIRLGCQKNNVMMSRRPMLQIYTAGESIINCFYDRHSFEVDCSPMDDYETLNSYHFTRTPNMSSIEVKNCPVAECNGNFFGHLRQVEGNVNQYQGTFTNENGKSELLISITWQISTWIMNYWLDNGTIIVSTDSIDISYQLGGSTILEFKRDNTDFAMVFTNIYTRYVCDVLEFGGKETYEFSSEDPVADNRNYTRCIGASDLSISASRNFSETANEYGIAPNGMYYLPPDIRGDYYPIGRTYWRSNSLWFQPSSETLRFDREARGTLSQKDFYTLGGAIKALLKEIDPTLKHEETAEYSRFLYEQDPLTGREINLLITPKSNVVAGEYQTPAMKAPVHLNDILTMLKNTYQVYWYIEDGKFKLEHITFFERGGTYDGSLQVGIDLTEMYAKNRLPWAYGSDEYSFEKSDMPERYEFSWMDDVTSAFKGDAIQIKSNVVERGKKEDLNIPLFTSDVDYILLNGQAISQDGFVIIDADAANGIVKPDSDYSEGSTGTAILFPIKAINKLFAGTTSKLHFLPSSTSSVASFVIITFMKGEEVLSVRDGYIAADGLDKEIEVTIPDGCDGITYTATTPSVRVKSFALSNENIKSTSYLTMDVGGKEYTMQNGHLAMMYLQPNYWLYNMPSEFVVINNETYNAYSVSKNKTAQITFPSLTDPDALELVKTNIGNGQINKMSINLSSRAVQATLRYETK